MMWAHMLQQGRRRRPVSVGALWPEGYWVASVQLSSAHIGWGPLLVCWLWGLLVV